MPSKISIGVDSIKLWLQDNERSQAWLARQIDISPEHLNRIMKEHVPLHKDIENKLIDFIFFGDK